MVIDPDMFRAASTLIRQYSEGAVLEAVQRVNVMLAKNDMEGAVAWNRIVVAIEEIQRAVPGERENVH